MFKFGSRLKTQMSLIAVLLLLLLIPVEVKGTPSEGFVKHAVEVINSGGGYTEKVVRHAQGVVTAHINDVNNLKLSGKISNRQYQVCQRLFYGNNKQSLCRSSTSRIKIDVPEHPGEFNPGTDTDAIATVKNKGDRIKLDDVKEGYKNHQVEIRKTCQELGYEPPEGWMDVETDIMPDPECTSPRDHAKIAKWINDNGGCAYSSQDAVRAEIKLSKGENPNMTEAAAYQAEMREQINKQFELSKKAVNPIESQQHNFKSAKYIKRYAKLNESMRSQHLNTPHRTDITGVDAAVNEIDLAGRGGQTSLAAAKVRGLMKHASQKACRQYIETNIEIAKVHGPRSGIGRAAGRNIALELNNLPPSEANVMINQMENQLEHEFTTKTVQDTKRVRKLNQTAESTGAKFLRRVGYVMIFKDGVERVQKVYSAKDEDKPQLALEEGCAFLYGMTGATAGAGAAAVAGAAIGTIICPGAGTAVGTIFGFFWGIKGYMEGSAVGHKVGNLNAKLFGVDQSAGHARTLNAVKSLYDKLISKGIPKVEAEKAAELLYYGNLRGLQKHMKNLREKYVTNISEAMDKLNFSNAEKLRLYKCLCNGCGSIGGYFDPGFKGGYGYGPCRCAGTYNTWKSPLRADKKRFKACVDEILHSRYTKSQANFNEMHKENEAAYKQMLELVRRENAKSVRNELQEVGQLMQKDETLEKAAKLFNDIKELLLEQARNKSGSDLGLKLSQKANLKVVTGELDKAVKLAELADEVRDSDPETSTTVAHLKRMRDSWSKARSELFPEIIKKIDAGNLAAARTMIRDLDVNMGMNHKYPYAYKDPKYLALKKKFKLKEEELQNLEGNQRSEDKFKVVHRKITAFKGELTNSKPVDTHVINMPVNGTLNIKITTGPKLNFYGGIQLLDSDNKTSMSSNIGQGPDLTKTWSFSLLRAGTYHLKLAKDGRTFYYGPYAVEVSVDTQKFAADQESNDNFATANTLPQDQMVTGHLGVRGQGKGRDQVDYWKLVLPTEGKLSLYLTTSEKLNLYGGLSIYGSDKKSIHWWTHGTGINKTYKSKKLKPGTYYIKIEKDGRTFYWGSYLLKVNHIP